MVDLSAASSRTDESWNQYHAGDISAKQAAVTTSSSNLSSNDGMSRTSPHAHLWHPSLFRIRPFVGLAALNVAIVCLFSSLGILLGSSGEPVSGWYFPPSVYLAIATAVSNTALSAALAQAAPIRWWYKAYKGSSVRDLELEWEAGQSFPRAIIRGLQQGRHFNFLTLSSLVVALVVVDGPLLQRSSSVKSATVSRDIVQNISITPELPTGFSGTWHPGNLVQTSSAIAEIGGAFADEAPILTTSECEGSCAMKVKAPGVAKLDCVTKHWPINRTILQEPSATWGSRYRGSEPSKPLMYVNFFEFSPGTPLASGAAGPEVIMLIVGRLDVSHWDGAYIETNCSLRSAVLEYDILLQGHEISFGAPLSSGRVVALANNTYVNTSATEPQPITLAPFGVYLESYLSANASCDTSMGPNDVITVPEAATMNAMAMKHLVIADPGSIIMSDPTNQVLNGLNELMFRGGVLAGTWRNDTALMDRGLHLSQSIRANQTLTLNIFESDLRWYAGAATIQIIALVLVLPIFWGWWELGLVDLTLSPFHLAKLLEAPLLNKVNSAAGVREMLRDAGDVRIKLGLIEATRARQDSVTGVMVTANGPDRMPRLGIAESPRVAAPFKGMRLRE